MCWECGTAVSQHLHHKVPLSVGGKAFQKSNLAPLCAACHRRAHLGPAPKL